MTKLAEIKVLLVSQMQDFKVWLTKIRKTKVFLVNQIPNSKGLVTRSLKPRRLVSHGKLAG